MITLTHHEVMLLLLQLSILLIVAKIFGELSRLIKQPAVIGEIIAGIILGPSIFGQIAPDLSKSIFNSSQQAFLALDGLSNIGVILLMFVAGMELELNLILSKGKTAGTIGFFGIAIPFSIGFGAAWFFYDSIIRFSPDLKLTLSLFFGTALSISALPVIAKTLLDLNLLKSQIGSLILAIAMIDDLIGWILFSIILSMMVGSAAAFSLPVIIISLLVFIILTLTFGKAIIDRIIPFINRYIKNQSGIIAFSLVLCLLGALFTEYMGVHAIFGAFIIGMALGNTKHFTQTSREIIHEFTSSFFAPLFFVMIGLKVNFIANFDYKLVLFVMFFSFTAKFLGVGLPAYFISKLNKFESLALASGLNARGSMAIILCIIGLEAKIINNEMFVAIVIMALVTSITSGPFLSYFVNSLREISFKDLISLKSVFYTNASTKEALLKEMCAKASSIYNVGEKDLYYSVMQRESLISTGLQNHLAIPHAKMNITSPLALIAISKEGIEFDSLDQLPAKVIILLVTPMGDNNLQLNLLAEIAKLFGDINKINELLKIDSTEQLTIKIKNI